MAAGYPGSSATFGFGLLPNTSLLPQSSALGTTPWIPGPTIPSPLMPQTNLFGVNPGATVPQTPEDTRAPSGFSNPSFSQFTGVPIFPGSNVNSGGLVLPSTAFGGPRSGAAPTGAYQTGPKGLPTYGTIPGGFWSPSFLGAGGSDAASGGANAADPTGLSLAQFNKMFGSPNLTWTDIHTPTPAFTPLDPKYINQLKAANTGIAVAYQRAGAQLNGLINAYKNLPSLAPQARAQAEAIIKWQIGNIVAQQQQLRQQGVQTANVLNNLAKASANVQMGIGKVVGQDYRAAAQGIAGLGGAVSGALGSQLAQSQAAATANSPIGPPSTMLTPGVPTAGFAPGAAGAVNMIGGTLPAASITQQGRGVLPNGLGGATDYAANLAHIIQGAGQQNALGALAAGNQQAAALEPQIVSANNQLPSLINQTLQQLDAARSDKWNQLFGFAQARSQLAISQANSIADSAKTALSYGVSQQSAQNSFAQSVAALNAADVRANATGRFEVASANAAARARVMGYYISYVNAQAKAAGKTGLSANTLSSTSKALSNDLETWWKGDVSTSTSTSLGKPVTIQTVKTPPMSISDAWQKMQRKYPIFINQVGKDAALSILTSQWGVPGWTEDQVNAGIGPVNLEPGAPWGPPPDQPQYQSRVTQIPFPAVSSDQAKANAAAANTPVAAPIPAGFSATGY